MDMKKFAGGESNYLKAADLKGKKIKVKISKVGLVEFDDDGKKEVKPVINFDGKEKGMVLNKTNTDVLGHAFGYESEGWIGKELELSTKYYPTFEKEGLVVEPFKEVEFNDDIPF